MISCFQLRLVPALLFLLAGIGSTFAQQPPANRSAATNRPPNERYLLIVETSAATQKRAENIQRVVGQLFSSGLRGELDPGDTIGAWAYDDTLHTGQVPLQRWTPQTRPQITVTLVQFLQSRRFQKEARLAPVAEALTNLVANSYRLTVLVISDGSDARFGTPFDEKIAEAYKANAAEQRQQQMPFVTVLRSEKGKYIGYTVSTPPWPVEFPPYPGERRAEAAPPRPANPNPPPVEPTPAPIPPPPATVQLPPPPPPNHAAENTNAPVVAAVPTPIATNAPQPIVETNPPPLPATTEIEPPIKAAPAPEPNAPTQLPRLLLWSLVSLGLVIVSLLLLILLRPRNPPPRVSLITRSMNRDNP